MFNLMPWQKKESDHPMVSLRQRMDRLFDDFFADFQDMGLWPAQNEKSSFMPRLDISESEKQFHIHAELPGMTEKDVEVTMENNVLTLKGEKKQEEEHKDKNYHRIERHYGSFYRSIPLPDSIEADKIEASFKKGVLEIIVPKKESVQKGTKIEIKAK